MSTTNTGGPAFPCIPPQDTGAGFAVGYPFPDQGMTLRDYFAAKAMQSLIIAAAGSSTTHTPASVSVDAYETADAMLKAREGGV